VYFVPAGCLWMVHARLRDKKVVSVFAFFVRRFFWHSMNQTDQQLSRPGVSLQ
jgi:hypothetical protein